MRRMNTKSKKGGQAPALNAHKHFKGDDNARPRQEAKKEIEQAVICGGGGGCRNCNCQ